MKSITMNKNQAMTAIMATGVTVADMRINYIKNGGYIVYPTIVNNVPKLAKISFRHQEVIDARATRKQAKKLEREQKLAIKAQMKLAKKAEKEALKTAKIQANVQEHVETYTNEDEQTVTVISSSVV